MDALLAKRLLAADLAYMESFAESDPEFVSIWKAMKAKVDEFLAQSNMNTSVGYSCLPSDAKNFDRAVKKIVEQYRGRRYYLHAKKSKILGNHRLVVFTIKKRTWLLNLK